MVVVDAEALAIWLDGRWAWVRDEARRLLADPLFAPVVAVGAEEHRARVLDQLGALARTEGPRALFPRSHGGGGDVGAAVTAFETAALGDLSLLVKAGVQWGLFGGAVLHLGTEHHHQRYLGPIMSLELLGAFAMTETARGSDVQSLATTATYASEDQEFVIHTPDPGARKDYIGNAARDGHLAAVFAQLVTRGETHGVHAFLVPIRDDRGRPWPGVTIEDCGPKAGLNGVDNGRLAFDGVRVPREALLDRYGQVARDGTYTSPIESPTKRFFTMLGTLVQGRVSVAGAALSASKTALTIAVRYGDVRRQFSPPGSEDQIPILDFRVHQRRLLPALARTYALHVAQAGLVAGLHDVFGGEGEPGERARRELESRAAGTKALATWHATHTVQTCREACGGAGYLAVNRLPQLKADSDVFTTFEGDNTVLLQLVARGLLTDFREEFGALDALGTVRFVADQVLETIVEATAARPVLQRLRDAVPGTDQEADLLDRSWHQELFAWREQHVLGALARRIKRGIDQGREPFEVFNAVQDHVVAAAHAHLERQVLDAFVAGIESCPDEDLRRVLDRVCDLHVLSHLEGARGWFLEHGRLSPSRAKAIVAGVNDCCAALRPHAVALVDAFGVPEELLPPLVA
ncbi:MAG TPA: acyl-CoA dehydrogenase [Acidimicrobiales bacterium]|nr:acyl-CoA dehydrogenase [Acidimicrobiales bacterium]